MADQPQPDHSNQQPGQAFAAPPELIVIVRPEAQLRARGEELAAAADIDPLRTALQERNARMVPLFGVTEDRIRTAAAEATVTGVPVPDLSVFYRVEADGDLEELASRLRELDLVEAAYVKPPAELPQALNQMTPAEAEAPPVTPDFTGQQGYLDVAPGGIDARYAWTIPGGEGAGVRIIDIEGAWRFSHEDLLQNQGGVIGGTPSTDLVWENHGTAVAGEFGGDRNTFGITGICPQANVRAVSIFGPNMGSAAAIRQAASALGAGDIILIELHRPGPNATGAGQLGYIPIEWWEDDFAAILFATGRGVIVVEAGGNGSQNLDDPVYNNPQPGFPPGWRNPFNRANRDSGAIVIGAGAPPSGNFGPDRSRLDFSNYGSMVDTQGWGREVVTTGYGDLQGGTNRDFWYTRQFSGTSSASPIVVGALGSLQGVLRARSQSPLLPAAARNLLRATGSAQQDAPGRPASERIGNRPDLRELIRRIIKQTIKDTKEKNDFKDRKDRKEFLKEKEIQKELTKDKEFSKEKDKDKEKEKEKEVQKERKDIKDRKELAKEKEIPKEKDQDLGGAALEPGWGMAVEQRLAQVETAVAQLAHFIGTELRPDLGAGALGDEPDLSGLSQQLGTAGQEAKELKDASDTGKFPDR